MLKGVLSLLGLPRTTKVKQGINLGGIFFPVLFFFIPAPWVLMHAFRKLDLNFLSNWMGYDRVLTVFLLIFWTKWNSILVQNQKENCHHDHIPFNVKGNGNIVFSVWGSIINYAKPSFVVYWTQCDAVFNPIITWGKLRSLE